MAREEGKSTGDGRLMVDLAMIWMDQCCLGCMEGSGDCGFPLERCDDSVRAGGRRGSHHARGRGTKQMLHQKNIHLLLFFSCRRLLLD